MSLWYKNLENITFGDVESFCLQMNPEGYRLDYKGEWPNDLSKLVSAFANTLGGLILLGVAADKKNNVPIWPPQGLASTIGIQERIIASCRDQIYPPIRPLISPVLPNPHAAGIDVVVIRVDESPEAPHAVKGKVYERTGNQNYPYDIANIDRIEMLLRRRGRVEEEREAYLGSEIDRAKRRMAYSRFSMPDVPDVNMWDFLPSQIGPNKRPLLPIRWASIIPLFPWRDLCDPKLCYMLLASVPDLDHHQRAPGGAFGIRRAGMAGNPNFIYLCSSLSTRGHVFAAQCAAETIHYITVEKARGQRVVDLFLDIEQTTDLIHRTCQFARDFYQNDQVERPGFLRLSMGLLDVLNFRMVGAKPFRIPGDHFVDDTFRTEAVVPTNQYLDDPQAAAKPLIDDLSYSFNIQA
jgi:hypothetical protein